MTPAAERFVDVIVKVLALLLEAFVSPGERDVVVAAICAKLHTERAKSRSWLGRPIGKDDKR